MTRLLLILIFCSVSGVGSAIAQTPVSEEVTDLSASEARLDDLVTQSFKSRLDMLERRIDRLDREQKNLKDRLRSLDRNVSDIRRRNPRL